MKKECTKCLRGARIDITGVDKRTLKMDMGGAVLYVCPKSDGSIDVHLNTENLLDGNFAACEYAPESQEWIITRKTDEVRVQPR